MACSPERKAAVLKRMLPPNTISLRELSREEGISEMTLSKWRAAARAKGAFLPDADAGPEGWTARDKFAAVIETASMNETALAEYCRQRGLYPEQVALWREAREKANDWERSASTRIAGSRRVWWRPEPPDPTQPRSRDRLEGLNNLSQESEVCAAAHGDDGLTDTNLQAGGGPQIRSVAHDNPGEPRIIAVWQDQKAFPGRCAPAGQMLGCDLMAARNIGDDGARSERFRHDLGLLLVGSPPPVAAGENLEGLKADMLHHMVHHVFQN